MIENFDSIKKQLSELATVLNAFKSEAVQLRILELIFGRRDPQVSGVIPKDQNPGSRARLRRTPRKKISDITTTRKKAPTGAGAPATLTSLLLGDFFDEPRTIKDIIEHSKHYLARTFKANDFSGKLARLVRSGELTREKNTDNQYEYKKP